MSASTERIHKRRTSIVRPNLLRVLLHKYIRKMYGDVTADRTKLIERQLIRHEYYNDIFECILNNCQLTKSNSELNSIGHYIIPMRKERVIATQIKIDDESISNKLDEVETNPR